ncbi:hypothetical protein ABZU94_08400 [Streptomyces mirabilis]|uniref:hypothetical protein n=1 Tax=Streptomyces sp. NPDC005388 TaxID=3156717 RepID=UPI0033B219E8
MTDWLGTLAPVGSTVVTAIALLVTNRETMARIRERMGRKKHSTFPQSDRKGPGSKRMW